MTEQTRYLIVGLGNPGREYERTRHNIGFRAVEALAARHSLVFSKRQNNASLADGLIGGRKVLLAKPQTFMNNSGVAVRGLLDFYRILPANLLVIYDDLDVPLGTLRLRERGSAGGQKGIKSIIDHLGTDAVARVRFGIGRPPGRMETADYVLAPFARDEEIFVIETLDRAVRAAETWLEHGLEIAMTRHNGTADEAARAAATTPPRPRPSPSQTPDAPTDPTTE
jgi:PTH1 family peptidyl-tRNA hydrolase